jgi:hypothetical protein
LLSAGGTTAPAGSAGFIYAVFLAPSTTVDAPGQTVPLIDPVFSVVGGTNTAHPTAGGRLTILNNLIVQGGPPGGTVDFIVRGWSANAGATWQEALASWNNGAPLPHVGAGMYIGSSTIGNNIILGDGGAIPATTLFGAGAVQVGGFDMQYYPVPEPTSMALAGLGAAAMLIFRRRK